MKRLLKAVVLAIALGSSSFAADNIPKTEKEVTDSWNKSTTGSVKIKKGAIVNDIRRHSKETLTVYLPLGAQIQKVSQTAQTMVDVKWKLRYSVWREVKPGKNIYYAKFRKYKTEFTPQNVVVSAEFDNWSDKFDRHAKLTVYWTSPK